MSIAAHPRLNHQCHRILEAFRSAADHRMTGRQLQTIAPRFGARIYDLRKAGHCIELAYHNRATGFTIYLLRDGGRA